MIKRLFILLCYPFTTLVAQNGVTDTTRAQVLEEVVVKGYEQNRKLVEVAAPVSIISRQQLQRFGPGSILPAVNAAPGVRMEERSPGSYRLNIRGSSLRSPFGVRNVKIYWNNIPFTDPGGNTYLNQFSFYNISSIEILKGPGSSLYGAGTGGVMLLNSFSNPTSNRLSINYARGSYASNNLNVSLVAGNENFRNMIAYTHQNSDGYREQSAMRRDVVSWESKIRSSEKQSLSTHLLFGDLFYETPGGLTKAQFLANPKSARPPAGVFPGAIQNKAAIYQKTFWAGVNHQYQFNTHWQNSTSVYGAFSQIRNPAIRNYERRLEPHFGGRTTFSYTTRIKESTLKVVAGAEVQQGYSSIKVYSNKRGSLDTLQNDDEVDIRQSGAFAQAEIGFPGGWIATGGFSVNNSRVQFDRFSDVPPFRFNTDFNNELAPRFSMLKKITEKISVYGLVSKGFSPPTVAEILPSTSVINTGLQAEQGINYELGLRGILFDRLSFDVNGFYFRLQNAITQRRDQSGADYFVNAGKTKQQGVETSLSYAGIKIAGQFVSQFTLWFNHTYHHFRYADFKQVNTEFSGNRIPSIAQHTIATGLDLITKPGLYAHVTYYYSDPIALNDVNTDYASSYNLLGCKAGFRRTFGHVQTDLFISGDNLFDQTYSLGNDINAAANRFYNAAPGVNYQVGVGVQYVF
ncbi:MAG: TonB-dependent receptor [Chitinophagaceae bacterium]